MNVKIVRDTVPTPMRAHACDAGLDLVCAEDLTLKPNEVVLAPTGIAVAIPEGYVGLLFPRSGMASKKRITLANSVGVIDAGYRGEIKAALVNESGSIVHIDANTRIAQLVISPIVTPEINIVKDLDETDRGAGGFGSSGFTSNEPADGGHVFANIIEHFAKRAQSEQLAERADTLLYRASQPGMKLRDKDRLSLRALIEYVTDYAVSYENKTIMHADAAICDEMEEQATSDGLVSAAPMVETYLTVINAIKQQSNQA